MKFSYFLVLSILTIPLLSSCGGSSGGGGGGGSGRAEQEEEGSTTGGSTSGGGGSGACVSSTRRTNVTNVLNKMAQASNIPGSFSITETSPAGSNTTMADGSYTASNTSTDNWNIKYSCVDNGCQQTDVVLEFREDGCFYANGQKATISSSSPSSVSYRWTDVIKHSNRYNFSGSELSTSETTENESTDISLKVMFNSN